MRQTLEKRVNHRVYAPARWCIRNLVRLYVSLKYQVNVTGFKETLTTTNGAIVLANHVSRLDGPLIMSIAYPHAYLYPCVWWSEYKKIELFMKCVGAISVGSPKDLPLQDRSYETQRMQEAVTELLSEEYYVLLFPEGGINTEARVSIKPHYHGAHDMIEAHPEVPVLIVHTLGLGDIPNHLADEDGTSLLWWRTPIRIHVEEITVSTEGGPARVNADLEAYFNSESPLSCAQ